MTTPTTPPKGNFPSTPDTISSDLTRPIVKSSIGIAGGEANPSEGYSTPKASGNFGDALLFHADLAAGHDLNEGDFRVRLLGQLSDDLGWEKNSLFHATSLGPRLELDWRRAFPWDNAGIFTRLGADLGLGVEWLGPTADFALTGGIDLNVVNFQMPQKSVEWGLDLFFRGSIFPGDDTSMAGKFLGASLTLRPDMENSWKNLKTAMEVVDFEIPTPPNSENLGMVSQKPKPEISKELNYIYYWYWRTTTFDSYPTDQQVARISQILSLHRAKFGKIDWTDVALQAELLPLFGTKLPELEQAIQISARHLKANQKLISPDIRLEGNCSLSDGQLADIEHLTENMATIFAILLEAAGATGFNFIVQGNADRKPKNWDEMNYPPGSRSFIILATQNRRVEIFFTPL
jgi:hypothetical protein